MKTTTGISLLILAASLTGCAYHPRWTPETVQPPASLVAAIDAADAARDEGRARLGTADEPTTMSISRDGAILSALARNRSLQVERFNPLIRETSIDTARAAFDPSLLATVTYGRNRNPSTRSITTTSIDPITGLPVTSTTSEPSVAQSYSTDGTLQLTERLPTGTALTLAGGLSRNAVENDSSDYTSNWSARVSQSLLRGAGTAVNLVDLRQAKNNAEISAQAFRNSVLDLVQQVEDAYWELSLARESVRIREYSVKLAEEQLRFAEARLRVGSAIRADVLSAQAEAASRRAGLVDARAAERRAVLNLLRLLSPDSPDQWAVQFDPVDQPDVTRIETEPKESTELALMYRPDLAQSRLNLANSDLEVIRTKNGLLPRLDAFGSYGRRSFGSNTKRSLDDLDNDRYDQYSIGAELEFSPINRSERARARSARFSRQQAEASITNLEQLIALTVRQDIVSADQQIDQISATKIALESRREELRAIEARYGLGSATILDVLLVQNNLVQAELNEVTARVRYIQALTALYRDEGTLLDRRGVGVPETK